MNMCTSSACGYEYFHGFSRDKWLQCHNNYSVQQTSSACVHMCMCAYGCVGTYEVFVVLQDMMWHFVWDWYTYDAYKTTGVEASPLTTNLGILHTNVQ